MTWGAINEWTAQAAYARLAARADHPVLTELLRRIMRTDAAAIPAERSLRMSGASGAAMTSGS